MTRPNTYWQDRRKREAARKELASRFVSPSVRFEVLPGRPGPSSVIRVDARSGAYLGSAGTYETEDAARRVAYQRNADAIARCNP